MTQSGEISGILLSFITVVLVTAAVSDIRSHRIPNWLTFPAAGAGLGYHTYLNGVSGLIFSLAGLAAGLGLLIAFYLAGGMGAGDVKLLGAVGALIGPKGVFLAFVYTAILGGAYALILLVLHKELWNFLKRYSWVIRELIMPGSGSVSLDKRKEMPALCYGVVIALGTLLPLFKTYLNL